MLTLPTTSQSGPQSRLMWGKSTNESIVQMEILKWRFGPLGGVRRKIVGAMIWITIGGATARNAISKFDNSKPVTNVIPCTAEMPNEESTPISGPDKGGFGRSALTRKQTYPDRVDLPIGARYVDSEGGREKMNYLLDTRRCVTAETPLLFLRPKSLPPPPPRFICQC